MSEYPVRCVLDGVPRVHFYEGGKRCPEDIILPSVMITDANTARCVSRTAKSSAPILSWSAYRARLPTYPGKRAGTATTRLSFICPTMPLPQSGEFLMQWGMRIAGWRKKKSVTMNPCFVRVSSRVFSRASPC